MDPASVMESLNAIGGTVGIPAALLVGYLFLRVRQLGNEVEKLRTEREADRREVDSKLNAIFDRLNLLLADVSFIKGRFSENK